MDVNGDGRIRDVAAAVFTSTQNNYFSPDFPIKCKVDVPTSCSRAELWSALEVEGAELCQEDFDLMWGEADRWDGRSICVS